MGDLAEDAEPPIVWTAGAVARRPPRRHPSRSRTGSRRSRCTGSCAPRLDAETLRHVLDDDFATHGLETTWNELCVPALTALGRRVTPAGDCVDAVLLLSWAIIAGLHLAAGPTNSASRAQRALLACPEGERHTIGLEALHAVLTERRTPANMLGPSVPTPVLVAAADRIRPAVVVVWSQARRTARTGLLRKLAPLAGTTIAAGPGWDEVRLPGTVVRVTTLRGATDAVTAATVPGGRPGTSARA
ncbi:hypothetical protein [Pseudonocardia nigra]|uniref:hypothetical protein n=1 Tax=Pseudonocardia nigra TaxID=1921578 RepID=UPI001C5F0822|nr:hypothetical protein [Pseudonocardia nigra]